MGGTHTWGLVLAGGAGRRLAGVTNGVPKQFWSPDGGATLLEGTLRRLAPVASADRQVVIVDRTHRPWLRDSGQVAAVVYQPADKGTAIAVLVGLLSILLVDSEAIVALSPADHGVAEPGRFHRSVRQARDAVEVRAADVILFGAEPVTPDGDYGWISPGDPLDVEGVSRVAGFVEKPGPVIAARLLAGGAVWNTMVLVGRGSALLRVFRRRLPDATRMLAEATWTGRRATALARAYRRLRAADFSRDVLSGTPGLALAIFPSAMGWSDLGTPERLGTWLQQHGTERTRQLGARITAA